MPDTITNKPTSEHSSWCFHNNSHPFVEPFIYQFSLELLQIKDLNETNLNMGFYNLHIRSEKSYCLTATSSIRNKVIVSNHCSLFQSGQGSQYGLPKALIR